MSEIVERLRELEAAESELACECDCPPEATANYRYAMTCAEAADLITALRAERERLRGALERIATDDESDADLHEWGAAAVARAALSQPAQPAIRTDSRYNNAERIFGDD